MVFLPDATIMMCVYVREVTASSKHRCLAPCYHGDQALLRVSAGHQENMVRHTGESPKRVHLFT